MHCSSVHLIWSGVSSFYEPEPMREIMERTTTYKSHSTSRAHNLKTLDYESKASHSSLNAESVCYVHYCKVQLLNWTNRLRTLQLWMKSNGSLDGKIDCAFPHLTFESDLKWPFVTSHRLNRARTNDIIELSGNNVNIPIEKTRFYRTNARFNADIRYYYYIHSLKHNGFFYF